MSSRETIGSRFGFLMLAAGCAIGLGNVWRFPFITGRNGGAVFVLVYLGFLILLGLPLMMMELAIGRASHRGMYGAFRDLPEKRPSKWRIPAGILFCGNLILMMMYTTVTGWMLYYFIQYITGGLFDCKAPEQTVEVFNNFLASPGQVCLYMLIAVILGSVVCGLGLRNGVERITKILMSLLFIVLGGLSLYALTLSGAGKGLSFYLQPNMEVFHSADSIQRLITDAMSQAFFTLSIGIGSIEIFGSYCDKQHSLLNESLLIILFDTIVALLAGVVIFTTCATFGVDVGAGPGLIFITFPQLLNNMPGGNILAPIFFLFMSIAAMTTVIAVFENLIAFMIDEWHFSRSKASITNFAAVFLLSLPCALGFNMWSDFHPLGGTSCVLDFEDWLVSDMFLPIGAVVTVFFCTLKKAWGFDKFLEEVNTGSGLKLAKASIWYLCVLLPVMIITLLVLGIYNRFFA